MRWLWFFTLILIVFLTGLLSGLYILWAIILILIDIYLTRIINWKKIQIPFRIILPGWIQIALWIIINVLLIRVFVLDNITVKNTGMQPVVNIGDRLIISKLAFGPRMPLTPLNLPFTHHYLPFSNKPSYLKHPLMDYTRLKGFRKIQQGDMLAYNFPEGDSVIPGNESINYYALNRKKQLKEELPYNLSIQYRPVDRREIEISRCAGIPGDTIQFVDAKLYIGASCEDQGTEKYNYLVRLDRESFPEDLLREFDIKSDEVIMIPNQGFVVSLSTKQATKIKLRFDSASIRMLTSSKLDADPQIFPHSKLYPWNRDNFGPVIVPSKGQVINLNINNICLYERLIGLYEANDLIIRDQSIFINGIETTAYRVKMDYYFVTGDNRHLSRDSRHWGFLPEDHIIGKPWFICLSLSSRNEKKSRINWGRMFESVN